jgi:hypothetical protein
MRLILLLLIIFAIELFHNVFTMKDTPLINNIYNGFIVRKNNKDESVCVYEDVIVHTHIGNVNIITIEYLNFKIDYSLESNIVNNQAYYKFCNTYYSPVKRNLLVYSVDGNITPENEPGRILIIGDTEFYVFIDSQETTSQETTSQETTSKKQLLKKQLLKKQLPKKQLLKKQLPRNNFSRNNFPRNNFSRNNFSRNNFSRNNFSRNNFPRNNFSRNNFSRNNFPRNNFSRNNFSRNNFPRNNFSRNNFPRNNFSRNNFSRNNFSRNNFPRNNFPRNNFLIYDFSNKEIHTKY